MKPTIANAASKNAASKNVTSFIKGHKLDIAIVIALFLLAFGVRAAASDRFQDIYGFDSFWGARQTQYLITQGWIFPYNDSITDYPYGRITNPVESGWWLMSAFSYKVVALLTGTPGFDYKLFGSVYSWLNALLGSLAIPALYLFGKKAYNRITGLAASLLLAGSGSHLFYSIYGHAENDATGLMLFFASFFLLAWTIKSRDKKVAALFALTLAWLSITWQAYIVIVLLAAGAFTLYFVAYYLMSKVKMYQDSEERAETRKWMIYSLVLMLPSVLATKFIAITQWDPIIILPLTVSIIIGSLAEVKQVRLRPDANVKGWPWQQKTLALGAGFLIVSTILVGALVFKAPLAFAGLASEPRNVPEYALLLDQTIAEQNPIPGEGFIGKLTTLSASGFGNIVWLAFFGAIFAIGKLVIMPLIRRDFRYEWDLIALGFILFSMIKLTSINQTTFFLTAALTFGTGYLIGQIYVMANYFGKQLAKTQPYVKAALYVFALLMGLSFNTVVISNAAQYNYDIPVEWFQTFDFINNNLAAGSVVTPWWDYGHW
ncbi:hypothetical protein HY546_00955, partial [archaeon]|nr:hypothetical protein [archaeon]